MLKKSLSKKVGLTFFRLYNLHCSSHNSHPLYHWSTKNEEAATSFIIHFVAPSQITKQQCYYNQVSIHEQSSHGNETLQSLYLQALPGRWNRLRTQGVWGNAWTGHWSVDHNDNWVLKVWHDQGGQEAVW